jgi:hypothetical protein
VREWVNANYSKTGIGDFGCRRARTSDRFGRKVGAVPRRIVLAEKSAVTIAILLQYCIIGRREAITAGVAPELISYFANFAHRLRVSQ